MKQYELGGVKFIVHEGEIYCRYADVFDEEEVEEEEAVSPSKAEPKEGKVRKCGKCGKPGHQARTCPKTASVSLDDEKGRASQNAAIIANREKVARMIRGGASESEVYAAMHDSMTDAELREALELAGA